MHIVDLHTNAHWHIGYFELEQLDKQQKQEESSDPPFVPLTLKQENKSPM